MESLEDEIRTSLLNEGKDEIVSGGFKILMRENGQIQITELPLPNLAQLELPLNLQSKESRKEDSHETTKFD